MTPAAFALVLAVALSTMGLVVNHIYARLALVELALNEGLPPGHEVAQATTSTATPAPLRMQLEPGVHIFLSRSCHACQRLLDELDTVDTTVDASIFLRYVDRPRPLAATVAHKLDAKVEQQLGDVAVPYGADPLPYTIAVGAHDLVAGRVSPTLAQVIDVARDAGITSTAAGGQ